MNTLKSAALVAAMAATCASAPVSAYEAGDFIARAGWAHLEPDDSADDFSNLPGTSVKVDSADTLGISFSYLVTDHIGVGLLGVYPFTVDIEGDKGALANDDKVADTKALPPTLTLQYHFDTGPDFHPYIGAGINYTYFWDESTKNNSTLGGSSVDLENSWGLAGELGLDYTLANDYLLSAQVWYVNIETTARSKGVLGDPSLAGKADVDINPWVFMLGVGKKF